MAFRLQKILFAGALSLCSCIASAAPLLYEFSTILKLNSGPDTGGLNGAAMHFMTEIADGTTFTPLYQFQTFGSTYYQWTITGSGSVNGTYAGPNGAMYVAPIGWADFNGAGFNFATFVDLVLYQSTQIPFSSIQAGDVVGPEHFGALIFESSNPGIDPNFFRWKTSDGSIYNWGDNAEFTVTEVSAVPAPSTLALFGFVLGFAAWLSTKRRRAHWTCVAYI